MVEYKKDPTFNIGKIEPNKPVKLVLGKEKAVWSGENKFKKMSYLWPVTVTGQTVWDKESNKETPNYTGKAVLFGNDHLNTEFTKLSNGKVNTEVEVTVVPKKGVKGWYTTYEVKLVKEGEVPSKTSLSFLENNFLTTFKKMVDSKLINNDKEEFFMVGKMEPYNYSDENLEQLWATANTKIE